MDRKWTLHFYNSILLQHHHLLKSSISLWRPNCWHVSSWNDHVHWNNLGSQFSCCPHLLVWGNIGMWYIFLLIYGAIPSTVSGNAHKLLGKALAPATIYWTTTVLVTIVRVLPYFAHIVFQWSFNPLDHHIIQEINYYKYDVQIIVNIFYVSNYLCLCFN